MPRARDRNGRHSRLPSTPLPHRKVVILGLILALNNWSLGMIFSSNYFLPNLSLVGSAYLGKTSDGYYCLYLCCMDFVVVMHQ